MVDISDWNDLANAGTSDTLVLQNTLDKNTAGYSGIGDSWNGFSGNAFTGTVDGNGYAIKDLKCNVSDQDIGLFQEISNGGLVQQLIVDVDITHTGSGNIGGICGTLRDGKIRKCSMFGKVDAGGRVGGAFGIGYSGAEILDSYSGVNINNAGSEAGGLVGTVTDSGGGNGSVTDCYSFGLVSNASYPGGLVGGFTADVTVNDSYWDTKTSGQNSSNGGTGLTTSKMQGSSPKTNMSDLFVNFKWETVLSSDKDVDSDGYIILDALNRKQQLIGQGLISESSGVVPDTVPSLVTDTVPDVVPDSVR